MLGITNVGSDSNRTDSGISEFTIRMEQKPFRKRFNSSLTAWTFLKSIGMGHATCFKLSNSFRRSLIKSILLESVRRPFNNPRSCVSEIPTYTARQSSGIPSAEARAGCVVVKSYAAVMAVKSVFHKAKIKIAAECKQAAIKSGGSTILADHKAPMEISRRIRQRYPLKSGEEVVLYI